MLTISVVIPTYNRESTLERAVESVLRQDDDGVAFEIKEIVIVDDGSTDNTETVVASISDKRIRYYRQENGGAGKARNTGVGLAKATWIAFQDSDDIWHTDKLKKQVEYLENHSECSMVIHSFRAILPDEELCYRIQPAQNDIMEELAVRNIAGTPTMLLKKSDFLDVGGFDEAMRALEDWDFAIRFADQYMIGVLPDVLLDTDMSVSVVSANRGNYFDARCRSIVKNKAILQQHGVFSNAVENLLTFAQDEGVLKQVGALLERYLQTGV